MRKILPYLRLMRPANIVTSMADICAGFAASGSIAISYLPENFIYRFDNNYQLIWLLISTIGLYGGGIVFNDVFDASLDKVERPERPIPSGNASLTIAALLGSILFLMGISAAFYVSVTSGTIAIIITFLALIYDARGKHHSLLGPLNMGACRGMNLLLGISVVPENVSRLWFMALIPITFIAAITMISRGEVHGGKSSTMKFAILLYAAVILGIIGLSFTTGFNAYFAIPFLALFGYMVFPPLYDALRNPAPNLIMKAVKSGVISLIAMDAAVAAGFSGWILGVFILMLLPVSRFLSKVFAVT